MRQRPNGKPSCETSSDVTLARMSRARGPQSADRRPRRRHVDERCRAVVRQRIDEQLAVGHPVCTAGDDPEDVVAEAHDREVGLEAATGAEHRGVDDPADRHVHLGHHRVLQRVERTCSADVEDREGGEVEDAGVLAHREVLGVDDRRPPAGVPLARRAARCRSARRAARSPRTTAAAPSRRPRRRRRRAPAPARASASAGGRARSPTARPGGRSRRSSGTPRTCAPSTCARVFW